MLTYFTVSAKNQARLTQKIVGSYSWVFTASPEHKKEI